MLEAFETFRVVFDHSSSTSLTPFHPLFTFIRRGKSLFGNNQIVQKHKKKKLFLREERDKASCLISGGNKHTRGWSI